MSIKTSPLISVVIPSYNHSNYLSRAIKSIIDQTYTNWEIIVIDNHSKDGTDQIMNKFENEKIKLLKIHNDGIIAKSRNMGIREAKGEWIAFLDSDDWWKKNKLKICADNFLNSTDIIYHDLQIVTNRKSLFQRKLLKTRKLKNPILIDLLINGNAINNSSVIVKKKILEKINYINENKNMVAAEDYNTWLKISNISSKFLYLSQNLGYYQIHDQSVSKKDTSLANKEATKEFLSNLDLKQKIKLEARIQYISGRFNYINLNYNNSKKELMFVIKYGSIDLKIRALIMFINIVFGFNKFHN